jgi:diguanylate cyclase (GGDEF)-like protein/PAS domain S-box-containing protein
MKDYSIKSFFRKLILLTCAVNLTLSALQAYSAEPVRIGVLAYRPKPQTLEQWQPLAEALKQTLPEHDFEVQALNFSELESATANKKLDFVFTNPAHYILLTKRFGLSAPLATLATNENGHGLTVFGGVIFTRVERNDIKKLTDIKNKTIASTDVDSFGGYLMQTYELSKVGVNPLKDDKLVITGMPHDNVVSEVLNGQADIGFVRTGILEGMVREGNLDIEKLKIINRQKVVNFPFQTSTRLYPEWVFAYMPSVNENLARQVTAALLSMEENSSTIKSMNIHGFAVPADYTPVADLLKELRVKPFDIAPSFTLRDVLVQYKYGLIGALVSLGFIGLLGVRLVLTKRKLDSEHQITLTQQMRLNESETHLRTIINSEPECIKIVDAKGHLIEMNPAGLAMLEADSLAQLSGQYVLDVIAPEYRTAFTEMHKRVIAGASEEMEFEVIGLKGGRRWLETHAVPLEENGSIVHLAVTRDITERKLAEAELRIAEIAFESQEGILVTDANSKILRVNKAFTNITGYSAEEAIGQTPKLLSSGKQDKAFYNAMWSSITALGEWEGEIWNRRKTGEIYPEHLTITAVKDATGTLCNYVATLTDITMSKAASDEIKSLAFYDPLTKLPNRRLLLDRLRQSLITHARSRQRGALLFIDLDHFKTLNDTLGHDVGDLLLQQVAERLINCVREGDTVARLGGDEFVILLENLSDKLFDAAAQTELIGNKILINLNQPYQLVAHEHHSTPSIGATIFVGGQHQIDDYLKQADIAMYQAKKAGRNTLRFYDPVMQEAINARANMEEDLRIAIKSRQFQLYYQVQVDDLSRPLGAEALIRWQHPKLGLVSPMHFIPLAEETGLILPIGQWILETACAQLKLWEQNENTKELSISVNISPKQFNQADFVIQVQTIVSRHAINPILLKLELTESMLVHNVENIIITMLALEAIGVRFELDDFGTGYSSLQYLKQLPISQLKIDQSFVRDIAHDISDQAIVSTIIAMAKSLNLAVIAEGVETQEQQQLLLEGGCSRFQGYLFGKPLPIEQFEASI